MKRLFVVKPECIVQCVGETLVLLFLLCMICSRCPQARCLLYCYTNDINSTCILGVYNHWTGPVDWTGGLDYMLLYSTTKYDEGHPVGQAR